MRWRRLRNSWPLNILLERDGAKSQLRWRAAAIFLCLWGLALLKPFGAKPRAGFTKDQLPDRRRFSVKRCRAGAQRAPDRSALIRASGRFIAPSVPRPDPPASTTRSVPP